jgi:hypothetical protein
LATFISGGKAHLGVGIINLAWEPGADDVLLMSTTLILVCVARNNFFEWVVLCAPQLAELTTIHRIND